MKTIDINDLRAMYQVELDDAYDRGFFCGDGTKSWHPEHKNYTNRLTLCGEKIKLKEYSNN